MLRVVGWLSVIVFVIMQVRDRASSRSPPHSGHNHPRLSTLPVNRFLAELQLSKFTFSIGNVLAKESLTTRNVNDDAPGRDNFRRETSTTIPTSRLSLAVGLRASGLHALHDESWAILRTLVLRRAVLELASSELSWSRRAISL